MFRIQMKITCHTKKQENLNLNEKRQLKDTNIKMIHMLGLFDKGFKAAIINMLQRAITNI